MLQQQAILQATLASLPTLRSQLDQERNLLATYVGSLPSDYDGAQFQLDSLSLPQELPVSVPSKFVEQRPDVREYSALLHQATAQVGVATANLLPQLTLSGSYGGDAAKFSDVFSPASVVWSLAGAVTQPLFKGGQLVHQRRAAVAAAQEAAANYRATVITAFQNVSNTLYALQADADALAAQTAAERSAAGSLDLVQAQYKAGGASYLQVLTAEQTYQNAVDCARQGARAALCRHRSPVPSARRRLVEPHRRDRQFNRLTLRTAVSTMQPALAEDGKPVTLKSMIKPLVIMLIIVAVVLGGVFGWQAFIGSMTKKYMAGAATAPQTVSTAAAVGARGSRRSRPSGRCAPCAAPTSRRKRPAWSTKSSSIPATRCPPGSCCCG